MIGADGGFIHEGGQQDAVRRGQHERQHQGGGDGIAILGIGAGAAALDATARAPSGFARRKDQHGQEGSDRQPDQRRSAAEAEQGGGEAGQETSDGDGYVQSGGCGYCAGCAPAFL